MQKIISLFQRNYDGDHLVRDEVVPGAEWVALGEGIATQKFDGTCALVRDGRLYKRYDLKSKKGRTTPPDGWEPAQPEPDPVTTSWPGWIPVSPDNPSDKYFVEAFHEGLVDGTYELVGPKIQNNPEEVESHILVKHGSVVINDVPRTFDALRDYLSVTPIEGIVWHHAEGQMVKIKTKDFGLTRPKKAE